MLKGILVGIDGSDYSKSALDLAIRWAKRFDAFVVGIGVIDEPGLQYAETMPVGASYYNAWGNNTVRAVSRQRVDALLGAFALRCAGEGVAYTPLEDVGKPWAQIELESQRYDIVLLGKETHFAFEMRHEPDDTLLRILRQSYRPVVSVPAICRPTRRILVAYDGSAQAARALQAFEATGLAEGADVHVISIGDSRLQAARIADRAVQFLSLHKVDASAITKESNGQPANAILSEAQRLKVDLLVMGAYGRPSIREVFLGTVTRLVLNNSTLPVFLYH